MNPSYIAASITHTVQEKLTEYLITPFTNLFVILILVIGQDILIWHIQGKKIG